MTPISVNRSRSHPSPASSSPSFLQFGTILENSAAWNGFTPGRRSSNIIRVIASLSMPMRSQTACMISRSRMRSAASNANSWRSRISAAPSPR